MPKLPTDSPWVHCPKPEQVAAYVDCTLDAAEQRLLAQHLAGCPDCSIVLAETVRMNGTGASRHRLLASHPTKRVFLRMTGSLVAAAALCLAIWPLRGTLPPSDPSRRTELADLVAAVGSRRAIEPRLTGGFAYGALLTDNPTRSAESTPRDLPLELRAAALSLEKRAQGGSDPLALGAFGSAQLATGFSEKAVSTFEEATRLSARDPRLLSDTAAAYLVRAKDKNQIEDVARAVGFAQRAVEATPALAEARFNLALSLEGLSLRGEATKAWHAYLEVDPSSPWTDEAKRRIERLAESPEARWEKQRRVVIAASDSGREDAIRAATKQFPDTAYEFVENDLVPGWADAWLARDETKAKELARRARLFGQALADTVGERMALDVAASIERAQDSTPRADAIARGHQMFRDARALYERDLVDDSAELFAKASIPLGEQQSPFLDWSTLQIAISHYNHSRLSEALVLLERIQRRSLERNHLTLLGRTERMYGLVHYVKGEVGDSLERYQNALERFEAVGAVEDLAAIHSIIAENLEAVGSVSAAWTHRGQALAGVGSARTPRRRQTILVSGANMARRRNLLYAALALQNELLADAREKARVGAVFEGYLGRASLSHMVGQESSAMADLDEAGRWLSKVPDPNLTKRSRAEANLVRGELLQVSSPEEALHALGESLSYFKASGMAQRLARLYLALGRGHLAAGSPESAEDAFLEGIRILEQQRARLVGGGLSQEYFNLPWNLFDEMIALKAGRPGRASEALAFAERSRARSLVDSTPIAIGAPLADPAALAESLPANTVVIYYASLEKHLLAWVIRAHRVESFQRPLGSAALERLVAEYQTAVRANSRGDLEALSERLFDELIRPFTSSLPATARLVIVPDGFLNLVPFAALRDRTTQKYLIEDHTLALTPSATMLQRTSRQLEHLRLSDQRMLVVGNPTVDETESGGLPSLTGAESEARAVGTLFEKSIVLTGTAATKRAFIDTAKRSGIVHFAGHAIVNPRYPHLSHLMLASDGERSGMLFAHEISLLRLDKTQLVVLAACSTGAGALTKGEGPLSLARPFLASGVPSVVATLWDVNDASTRSFFAVFYESLRKGTEPADALRSAQLALLRDGDSQLQAPISWAGFVATGGIRTDGGRQ